MDYEILVDGKSINKGTLPIAQLNIKPQAKTNVGVEAIAAAVADADNKGKEILVNVNFRLCYDTPLQKAGDVVDPPSCAAPLPMPPTLAKP